MKLSTRSKGEIAQLKVQLVAAGKNLPCSLPFNVDSFYDLLLDDKGKISRVQIKYCNRKHDDHLELRLDSPRSNRKHYSNKDVDLLLVFLPSKDVVLAYGPKKFHKKKVIQINLKDPNSKHYYKNYIW